MLKIIAKMKICNLEKRLQDVNEEIVSLTKDYQNAAERLKPLLPKEDELLNAYFNAIKSYLETDEVQSKVDKKASMKVAEKEYREVCTNINWFERTKEFVAKKIEAAKLVKLNLENEIYRLKSQE